jgi:Ras GTPase-activating-like protein IQGAP2/3
MDRPLSSYSQSPPDPAASGILPYQKQLLERKSSLSRASSRTSMFPPANTPTRTTAPTHRWAPGHKSASSVDAVRNKWEERAARESSPERAAIPDPPASASQPSTSSPWSSVDNSLVGLRTAPPSTSMTMQWAMRDLGDRPADSPRRHAFGTDASSKNPAMPFAPVTNLTTAETPQPASPIKRVDSMRSKWERSSPERVVKDLPPIPSRTSSFASSTPLSPVGTGSTTLTRSDSTASSTSSHRMNSIRSKWEQRERELQAAESSVAERPQSPTRRPLPRPISTDLSLTPKAKPFPPPSPTPHTAHPTTTASLEEIRAKYGLRNREPSPERKPVAPATPLPKRHTLPAPISSSFLDPPTSTTSVSFATPTPQPFHLSTSTDFKSSSLSAVKHLGSFAVPSPDRPSFDSPSRDRAVQDGKRPSQDYNPPPPAPSANSAMFPAPYTSSGKTVGKKYGASLTDGRRLGRHLPRIASGDGPDHTDDVRPVRKNFESRRTRRQEPSEELMIPGITNAADVAGVPGRLRLSRASKAHTPAPLPSSRLGIGLWADVQRNLLQAYEYLCHVGEAQQWIEGCLGSELGFGVVEMEEGLRNGVVLAKLVRAFEGEAAVRRIYEVIFHTFQPFWPLTASRHRNLIIDKLTILTTFWSSSVDSNYQR